MKHFRLIIDLFRAGPAMKSTQRSLTSGVLAILSVLLVFPIAPLAQTQIDTVGTLFCSGSIVLRKNSRSFETLSGAELLHRNGESIKVLQSKLQTAPQDERDRLNRLIATLRTLNSEITACLAGKYDFRQAVALGSGHTCAVLGSGRTMCWGQNEAGQLGDGSVADSFTPVPVIGLSKPSKAVGAGYSHSCAVSSRGGVKCWGSNDSGQLGIGKGKASRVLRPIQLRRLTSGVKMITAGMMHTCALTTRGRVKCWGRNYEGELGRGTFNQGSSIPVDVLGLANRVADISAGNYHTCALLVTGAVQCWGNNFRGELGNGTKIESPSPVFVSGINNATSLAAGNVHTCAALANGRVTCWGYDNRWGTLGTPDNVEAITPVVASKVTGSLQQLTAGNAFTCGVNGSRQVECWGFNLVGMLGNERNTDSSASVKVVDLVGVRGIRAYAHHVCAIRNDRSLVCWGGNFYGQLGIGNNNHKSRPIVVPGLKLR